MKFIKKTKGLTIIEIITVIAIMATLSAIIYASFGGAQARSRDQKRYADLGAIQLSLETYFQKNGQFPTSLNSLVPAYIVSLPTPPSNGDTQYSYFPVTSVGNGSAICTSYHLWIRFETNTSYLSSKKGFDSTNLLSGIYECGSGHTGINASSTGNALVFDITP